MILGDFNAGCIDLILTNKLRSFQSKCVIETGLSNFQKMTLKMHFRKLSLKIINYREFEELDNERFMNSLQYTLREENVDYSKNLDKFYKICQSVLNNHAPRKKKYIHENNKPFMTNTYSRATMQRRRIRNNSFRNPTKESKFIYNKPKNFCYSSEKGKKGIVCKNK